MMSHWIETMGLIAAVILPLWNIPLIARIIKRRSSHDISLWWAGGVWVCLLFMAPSGLTSKDVVWKAFNIINIICFTIVVVITLLYRKKSA
ncbi:MAG: hypothetical protein WC676_02385 [Candidatus Omnitrophota bacterium]